MVEERRQTVEDSKELFEIGSIMENDYTETWCTLEPDEEISIRPSLVNKTVLCIRPMIEDEVYSLSPPIECATLKPEKKYVSMGKMRTTQETDDQLWFCINITRGFTEDIPVYVIEVRRREKDGSNVDRSAFLWSWRMHCPAPSNFSSTFDTVPHYNQLNS